MLNQFEAYEPNEIELKLPAEVALAEITGSASFSQIKRLMCRGSSIRKLRNILTTVLLSVVVTLTVVGYPFTLGITAILLWAAMNLFCRKVYDHVLNELNLLPDKVQDIELVVSMIGALAELDFKPSALNSVLETKLTHILPELTVEEVQQFSPYIRDVLSKAVCFENRPSRNYALYLKNHTEFVIAGLEALAKIGDPNIIKRASFLNKRTTDTKIENASRLCVNALIASREQIQSSQTLLRASQSVDTSSDILLRAAGSGNPSASEELLRASHNDKIH